jgi:hypothetical protein
MKIPAAGSLAAFLNPAIGRCRLSVTSATHSIQKTVACPLSFGRIDVLATWRLDPKFDQGASWAVPGSEITLDHGMLPSMNSLAPPDNKLRQIMLDHGARAA